MSYFALMFGLFDIQNVPYVTPLVPGAGVCKYRISYRDKLSHCCIFKNACSVRQY